MMLLLTGQTYTITGYAVGDDFTPGDLTASGTPVIPGLTVACPQNLTFGTMVYIEGVGLRICQDRGAFEGRWLDLAFATKEEALQWGKRERNVCILTGGE